MKIALVDDEKECLDEMEQFCRNFGIRYSCKVEIVPFISGEAFLNAFNNGGFSIVFMDIYMDGINGINTALKMRRQDRKCLLVFLTSSTEFMPNAFSCHAFEYITKPFSQQRITAVLKDALEVLPLSQKYIEVSSDRKTIRVFLDNITSVVTDAHYINIGLSDGLSLRCRMTISEFMKKTGDDIRFILVNKGIVLNADYILDFENNCCILENGEQFPVRVRDRLKIEQAAQNYQFEKIRSRQRYGKES